MLVLLLVACTHDPAGVDPGTTKVVDSADTADSGSTGDSTEETGDTAEAALTGSLTVGPNPDNMFSAIAEVTVDEDAMVVVEYGEDALDHATPPRALRAGEPTAIPVLGLRAGRSFELRAIATVDDRRWESAPASLTTDPLPAGWPTCTPYFSTPEDEYSPDEVLCSNTQTLEGDHLYGCWNRWGEPTLAIQSTEDDALFSMTPLPGGGWASTSYTRSAILFFNEFGAQVSEYTTNWFADTRYMHEYVDVHEVTPIVEGPWAGAVLFVTAAHEWLADGTYRLGNGVIVYDPIDDAVLYDYSFLGRTDDGVPMDAKMDFSRTGWGDYAEDWTHVNSVLHGLDDDGRDWLLLSLKAQNWVVKLRPDTDEIEWRLGDDGDFTLVDDVDATSPTPLDRLAWPAHQHGLWRVEVGERMRILMFDNGSARRDDSGLRPDLEYSRVIELEVDEDAGLVGLPFEWGPTDAEDPDHFYSPTRGNARLLPGENRVVFISGDEMLVREVGYPEGGARWEMTCPEDDEGMYRVHWFPDLYQRDWIFQTP